MQKAEKLYPGNYYHIYNRGNNRGKIFFEKNNYSYFLQLYIKYIEPIADTFAYCLNINHFHFLVRIKELTTKTSEVSKTSEVLRSLPNDEKTSEVSETSEVCGSYSQPFSNLFNAYAKAINKRYHRTGSLFQSRFGRKRITNEAHLVQVVRYIHFNPQKHGLVDDFRGYPFSSFPAFRSTQASHLKRNEVIEWFCGLEQFDEFHSSLEFQDTELIDDIFEEDI